jgi:hypothetical protein
MSYLQRLLGFRENTAGNGNAAVKQILARANGEERRAGPLGPGHPKHGGSSSEGRPFVARAGGVLHDSLEQRDSASFRLRLHAAQHFLSLGSAFAKLFDQQLELLGVDHTQQLRGALSDQRGVIHERASAGRRGPLR